MNIELKYCPNGRGGTLTATLGADVLHVDALDLRKAAARDRFVAALTKDREGIDGAAVHTELLKLASTMMEPSKAPAADADAVVVSDEDRRDALEMLRDPSLLKTIVDDAAMLGVAGEKTLAATIYVVGTSRLLRKPLAAIIQGLTSSGKSFIVDTVARLFPPETILAAHSMTPQALVHLEPGALVHRFVVGGERSRKQDDDTADATRTLREMLSDGRLSKLIAQKGGDGISTVHIEQDGPIAYVESTTVQNILDEDANRCLILSTDESPSQTRRIIDLIAARKDADDGADDSVILRRHHAAQRLLCRCRVRVPFARALADAFPAERTDARRSFGQLLSVIEAATLLHQFQRTAEPSDGAVIVATADDYAIARRLLAEPMARSLGDGVSVAARNFCERLRARFADVVFDSRAVAAAETVIGDRQTLRSYLRSLAGAGLIECVEAGKGQRPAKYRMATPSLDAAAAVGLPELSDLFPGDSHARQCVNA